MIERQYDLLRTVISTDDAQLGEAIAAHFAQLIARELEKKDRATVLLAPSPADHPVFMALRARSDIEWGRIRVLIVDAYVGLPNNRPQSTAWRLQSSLLDHVKPAEFIPLDGAATSLGDEIERYSSLLESFQPTVALLGVGPNGHLAFNEPPADFRTTELLSITRVAAETRDQILAASLFENPDDIPENALGLTIFGLLRTANLLFFATEPEKAPIVNQILNGPITRFVPASVLRGQRNATFYVGPAAATRLDRKQEVGGDRPHIPGAAKPDRVEPETVPAARGFEGGDAQ